VKAWIRYTKEFLSGPMTPWMGEARAGRAARAEAALPEPGPTLRGWRRYYVRIGGLEFRFAALEELRHCARVLAQKNLPPAHPNGHWLSRLPSRAKSWSYRSKAVKALDAALRQFLAAGDAPEREQDPFEKRIAERARAARRPRSRPGDPGR
jgi:hypothetical protein